MTRIISQKGQSIIVAILLITMLAILVPSLVWWSNQSGKASTKLQNSTQAFHLAEAGVDRGRWKLMESVDNWIATSSGTLTGYNFDKAYTDVLGGKYMIKIYADPSDNEKRIVESVGKDDSNLEVREIKVVYVNSGAITTAIRANRTIGIAAATTVEWGPIMSGGSIDTSGRLFPRYYSAGAITPQDTDGAGGINSDTIQWWSYYPVPAMPVIDFDFYETSATNSGTSPCGINYYYDGSKQFKGCHDTSGKPYYITGDVNFASGSGGNFIKGTVIALGNLSVTGNGGGDGSYNARVPSQAWKEYGNSWSHYKSTFDSAAPSSYLTAVANNYTAASSLVYPVSGVIVNGFLYTGGSQGLTGGGNGVFHGVLISAKDVGLTTSNFTLYYDASVAATIRTAGIAITQSSWDEVEAQWPSGY